MELMVTDKGYNEFSQRLNAVLDYIGFPPKGKARQSELGKLFDVGQKGARKWLECEGMPRQSRHQLFIEKLNEKGAEITGEWLFYGDNTKAPAWYKHLMGINEKGEYKVSKTETNPEAPQPFQNIDLSQLIPTASPATQELIKTLEQGLQEGRLDEEFITILNHLSQKAMDDKNRKNR
jgi:hypothetical protein